MFGTVSGVVGQLAAMTASYPALCCNWLMHWLSYGLSSNMLASSIITNINMFLLVECVSP